MSFLRVVRTIGRCLPKKVLDPRSWPDVKKQFTANGFRTRNEVYVVTKTEQAPGGYGLVHFIGLVHRTVSSLHYADGLSVAWSAWDGLPDTAW